MLAAFIFTIFDNYYWLVGVDNYIPTQYVAAVLGSYKRTTIVWNYDDDHQAHCSQG